MYSSITSVYVWELTNCPTNILECIWTLLLADETVWVPSVLSDLFSPFALPFIFIYFFRVFPLFLRSHWILGGNICFCAFPRDLLKGFFFFTRCSMNQILFFINQCVSPLVLRWNGLTKRNRISPNGRHVLIWISMWKSQRNPLLFVKQAAFRLFRKEK